MIPRRSHIPSPTVFFRVPFRHQLNTFLVFVLGLVFSSVMILPTKADSPPQPNLIVIMADDLGYGDLSCYGNEVIKTPNLDQLAAEGMKFTDFHSSGAVCSPTRAGLLTGRYQQRAGVDGVIFADPQQNRHHGLYPSEITFSQVLKETGYATACIGKWHLGYRKEFNPVHHQFDLFRGYVSGNVDYHSHVDRMGVLDWWNGLRIENEPGYSTYLIGDYACEFIKDNQDQPFCLYIAHEAPHTPYQGPNDVPVRAEGKKGQIRPSRTDSQMALKEMIEAMDKTVGQVMQTLQETNLEENTFVFFLSDNGGTADSNNGPLRGKKGTFWEGGHRVCAMAKWPGKIEAGTVSKATAISIDLMPTILEIAGAKVPEGHQLDGISLKSHLFTKEKLPNRAIYWTTNGKMAMRKGPWKLLYPKRNSEPELYHLGKDLGESNNLAQEYPDRVNHMTRSLRRWKEEVEADATPQKAEPIEKL
ncbi:N-acetylgalactosamine-6-sulfate sulfatase [Planctomycetales bacterium 10988]|nr:N-acetylgalactosamine-6-sulfate sulfatase [Planctomycetales bacterium 10988]